MDFTARDYKCDRCGHMSHVTAENHRARLCDRANCGGTQRPETDTVTSVPPTGIEAVIAEMRREANLPGFKGSLVGRVLLDYARQIEAALRPQPAQERSEPAAVSADATRLWSCGASAVGSESMPLTCPVHGKYCDLVCEHGYAPDAAPREEASGPSGELLRTDLGEWLATRTSPTTDAGGANRSCVVSDRLVAMSKHFHGDTRQLLVDAATLLNEPWPPTHLSAPRAEPSTTRAVWRPIETATDAMKTGRRVLLLLDDNIRVGSYRQTRSGKWAWNTSDGRWMLCSPPTHWAPEPVLTPPAPSVTETTP